jgi:hypothetical protein
MVSTYFFATGDDLKELFQLVETNQHFLYVRGGHVRGAGAEVYKSGMDLPNLGRASSDMTVSCDSYLVARSTTPIVMRNVEATRGDILTIDQLRNPDTIWISVGGRFSPTVLLAGAVETVSDTPPSRAMMASWRRAMGKLWGKRKAFLVGKEALDVLQAGGRLTMSVPGSREFDLS